MIENATAQEKKRPGRKPMTPEEKAAASAARAAEKAKADNLKPEIIVQYQGSDIALDTLVDAAKADFHTNKKRTLVTDLKLYVKPEDSMAYYVINGTFEGKISLVTTTDE
ncbi:MAG: hypothetical protein J1F18_13505 [Lachnospiraceae bacterium]|nr:hypothetical protein [Lachnospiraceae bacterium]